MIRSVLLTTINYYYFSQSFYSFGYFCCEKLNIEKYGSPPLIQT